MSDELSPGSGLPGWAWIVLFVVAPAVAFWWTIHVHREGYRLGQKHGRQRADLEHRHAAERAEMAAAKAAWDRAESAWERAKKRWRL